MACQGQVLSESKWVSLSADIRAPQTKSIFPKMVISFLRRHNYSYYVISWITYLAACSSAVARRNEAHKKIRQINYYKVTYLLSSHAAQLFRFIMLSNPDVNSMSCNYSVYARFL